MNVSRFAAIFVLFLLICSSVFAQTAATTLSLPNPEKEKAVKELETNALALVDQVTGDATALKNWENRALIAALAGDLLWDKDKKRARELFRSAANELVQANNLPVDKSKTDSNMMFFAAFSDTSPRRTILRTIANHDADLALQFLLDTRPPKLQEAINAQNALKAQPAQPNQQKNTNDIMSDRAQQYQVQQEISLEQSFASKAAEQDTKKAAKLLRDSLSKGVTNEVFNLLEKIHKKDDELAKQLTGEVVQKILDMDFSKDESGRSIGLQFLMKYGAKKSPPKPSAPAAATKQNQPTEKTDDKTPEFKTALNRLSCSVR
jgi:NADH dehydrogenase/NADH:ubiquinone oxidoreductase subunit G